VEEFASIYVFHLRGNQRTSGERSRREGGKIFGGGSRAPVAIIVLVKNPDAAEHGRIRFHNIGDYLSRDEKLAIISRFGSIAGVEHENGWQTITPDEHGDWLGQRDRSLDAHIALGDKKSGSRVLFEQYSGGVSSGRDAWVYNFSQKMLAANVQRMIATYNAEVLRFDAEMGVASRQERVEAVDGFVVSDSTKINWTASLKADVVRGKHLAFDAGAISPCLYRPFARSWLYYSRTLNERVLRMPRLFPLGDEIQKNRIISVPAPGNVTPFSTLMSNTIFDLSVTAAKAGTQCFPRYLYDEQSTDAEVNDQGNMLAGSARGPECRDAITDEGLAHFQIAYPGEDITKDSLFYYVYGLLHSEDYRARFVDNLSKQLPRIPAVKKASDFWAFVGAGRKLGDLHCDYETVEPYPVTFARGDTSLAPPADPASFYRVEQMKFGGKRPKLDKTTVIYNANITMSGIPLEAYDYVVNGKSALEWVMERQCVKADKASGIINDVNCYAVETVGDPAYPLKLFQRVITVSLETMKIVRGLPKLGDLS
jgi:predicted helicase